jgi:hypothetical protein
VSAAGGTGTVTSVTAADTSIVVAGTGAAPTIATGTLDVIAADHPPAANWSNNSHKITSLANGSAASDALAVGQVLAAGAIPIADLADPTTGKVIGSASSAAAAVFPPGYEIGYDQVTSASVTITSSTESSGTTLVTSSAYTFDGGAVICEFFCPVLFSTAGIQVITISLFESTTQITRLAQIQTNFTNSLGIPVYARYRFTPSAASHTYKVTAHRTVADANTSEGSGGTGGYPPMWTRFTKV